MIFNTTSAKNNSTTWCVIDNVITLCVNISFWFFIILLPILLVLGLGLLMHIPVYWLLKTCWNYEHKHDFKEVHLNAADNRHVFYIHLLYSSQVTASKITDRIKCIRKLKLNEHQQLLSLIIFCIVQSQSANMERSLVSEWLDRPTHWIQLH